MIDAQYIRDAYIIGRWEGDGEDDGDKTGTEFDVWLASVIMETKLEALDAVNHYNKGIEYLASLIESLPLGTALHRISGRTAARAVRQEAARIVREEGVTKWQSEPPKRLPSTLKSGKR